MAEAFFAVDVREEGVLLARGRFIFPGENELYCELAARAAAWLRDGFAAYARQVYRENEDPHKRFHFPRFEYFFSLRKEDGGDQLLVTLSQAGKSLAHYETRLFYRQSLLAPPPRAKRR